MKTKSVKTRKAPANAPADQADQAAAKPAGKCQAKEVGHRRCQCGSPDCGENIGQP